MQASGRRRAAALGPLAVLAGCAAPQPLTKPVEQPAAVWVVVLVGALLTLGLLILHVTRWMLGRWPGVHDGIDALLAYSAVFALVAGALTELSHRRADELFDRPEGDEPRVIVPLQAECPTSLVDRGFLDLEPEIREDECAVNHDGRELAGPLAAGGVALLVIGRVCQRRARAVVYTFAVLAYVPVSFFAVFGVWQVAPDLAFAALVGGVAGLVLAIVAGIKGIVDAAAT